MKNSLSVKLLLTIGILLIIGIPTFEVVNTKINKLENEVFMLKVKVLKEVTYSANLEKRMQEQGQMLADSRRQGQALFEALNECLENK